MAKHFKHKHHAIATHQLVKKDAAGNTGTVDANDIQNDTEYLAPVQIGTPAQTLNLDFDTGSSDLWVWSTSLPSSTQSSGSSHTIFDPSKSSTWKASSGETWQISYGDGSTASGTVGTDVVTLGGIAIQNQSVEIAKTISAQFAQSSGDGLLGLAFDSINTVQPTPVQTPVGNMAAQGDIPSTSQLFTAYLSSWRDTNDPDKGQSFYTFGEIDQSVVAGQAINYTPVDSSQGFWQFASTSSSVNGKSISLSGGSAIADTGTTLAMIDDATCKAIYAAIPGATYDSTQQGYIYPSNTSVDALPVVQFAIGDSMVTMQKEDLGFADAGNGMTYGSCQSRGNMTFSIYGDALLKSMYAIFDLVSCRYLPRGLGRPELLMLM